jgi:hypothetical protein
LNHKLNALKEIKCKKKQKNKHPTPQKHPQNLPQTNAKPTRPSLKTTTVNPQISIHVVKTRQKDQPDQKKRQRPIKKNTTKENKIFGNKRNKRRKSHIKKKKNRKNQERTVQLVSRQPP